MRTESGEPAGKAHCEWHRSDKLKFNKATNSHNIIYLKRKSYEEENI